MNNQGKCPDCGRDTYITKRMTLSWLDVSAALLVSSVLFYFLYLLISSCCHGGNHGKFIAYLIFGVVGLVGWIFAYFVRKETFLVENCTRCDFKQSTKVVMAEDTIER